MFKNFIFRFFSKVRRKLSFLYNKLLIYSVKKSKYVFGLNTKKRDFPETIVSLTTYSKRLPDIDLCIKSILNQKFKPDRIIIWLGSDTDISIAKKYLDVYKKYGVEYYIDSEHNYMSHKKYIYCFERFKDSIVITLDDDLIFSHNTLLHLIKKYKKYPDCIIAKRVHLITNDGKKICNYRNWKWEYFLIRKPSNMLCPTTGAGTLFPPHIFPEYVCDFELIEKYSLTADDIWLKMMAVKNKVKVVWSGDFFQMPPEVSFGNTGLVDTNVGENKNDIYITKIMLDFNISLKDIT